MIDNILFDIEFLYAFSITALLTLMFLWQRADLVLSFMHMK